MELRMHPCFHKELTLPDVETHVLCTPTPPVHVATHVLSSQSTLQSNLSNINSLHVSIADYS